MRTTGGCPRTGYNGVRAAHRNAWRLVEMANSSMAVFEVGCTHTRPPLFMRMCMYVCLHAHMHTRMVTCKWLS